jgi:hypothetical protein
MKKFLVIALIVVAFAAVAVATNQPSFDPPPCWLWPQGCRG